MFLILVNVIKTHLVNLSVLKAKLLIMLKLILKVRYSKSMIQALARPIK